MLFEGYAAWQGTGYSGYSSTSGSVWQPKTKEEQQQLDREVSQERSPRRRVCLLIRPCAAGRKTAAHRCGCLDAQEGHSEEEPQEAHQPGDQELPSARARLLLARGDGAAARRSRGTVRRRGGVRGMLYAPLPCAPARGPPARTQPSAAR